MKIFDAQRKPEQQSFLRLMLKAEAQYDGLFGEEVIHESPGLLMMQKSPSIFRGRSIALTIRSPSIKYSVESLNSIFFPDPKIESHFSRPGISEVKFGVVLVGGHHLSQHKKSRRGILALAETGKESSVDREPRSEAPRRACHLLFQAVEAF